MAQLDAAFERLAQERRQSLSDAESRSSRREKILGRARAQVFGTTSEVIRSSAWSGDLRVIYCDRCPCIPVRRNDGKGLATRIQIRVDDKDTAQMSANGYSWVEVETNAVWLRQVVSESVAADLLNRPLGLSEISKSILAMLALILASAVIYLNAEAILNGLMWIFVVVVLFGWVASIGR